MTDYGSQRAHSGGGKPKPESDKYKVLDMLRDAGEKGLSSRIIREVIGSRGFGFINTLKNEGYGIRIVKRETTYYLDKDVERDKQQVPGRKSFKLNDLTVGGPVKVVRPARKSAFYGGRTKKQPYHGKRT